MNEPQVTQSEPDELTSAQSANDDIGGQIDNLGIVLDIPITLSLEIGRVRMRIEELMGLSPESVVDLKKAVDEPLDVLVNGTLIAHGEAVVVDGVFGIRLTDIVSKKEIMKNVA